MKNISILTLFPDLYEPFINTSLLKRAQEKNLINFDLQGLFSFAKPKERIDAPGFGPGDGMLIKPEIVEKAIDKQEKEFGKAYKIFFSPQGKLLNQTNLKEIYNKIADKKHIMLLSSRYEGMDSRVEEYYADEILSVGNFVTMGGDIPAMLFLEAILRYFPEIVGKVGSVEQDSFSGPFVDYPQYTEPVEWKGMVVPEILRSGNHGAIEKWRLDKAAQKTVIDHFEWVRTYKLNEVQKKVASKFIPNHYVALMHSDVLLEDNRVGTTSVTSIDIHDISRSCATYGIKNYFIVTPLKDQQKIVSKLLHFWQEGYGFEYNPQRFKAIKNTHLKNDLKSVIEAIKEKENIDPIIITTSAKRSDLALISYFDQSKVWSKNRPILLIFGTGKGLSDDLMAKSDFQLKPIEGFTDFNHLSVRSAVAIILDKWLGLNEK
ncbi:tRNA (guanosine(37)-N1)-methyltransferase TrmD [candidate division TM6 bacterium RIFCSPHIGHO2_12_FULL_32_22]|nr:MAG: tRNA (guanosine(37)-N1)-methyltransferase TrmD [candidate division TM6 bacterium RIFCSPHIGHO2_12_FULL_32_22]